MNRLILACTAALAACASSAPKNNALVDLRVCVQDETLVEAYAKHFAAAVASDPRGGRECDVTASAASRLNAEKVTLRSAYDGSLLAELEGPVELAPQLAAISLARGTDVYGRVATQRLASGFHR